MYAVGLPSKEFALQPATSTNPSASWAAIAPRSPRTSPRSRWRPRRDHPQHPPPPIEGDEASQAALAEAEAALAEAQQMAEEQDAAAAASKGTIAFSYGNERAGIYTIVADPARIEAERRGYDWIERSANGNCEKQVQDIEGFVASGVDAIVFLPPLRGGASPACGRGGQGFRDPRFLHWRTRAGLRGERGTDCVGIRRHVRHPRSGPG